LKESLLYCIVNFFGRFIRVLPLSVALWIGKAIGVLFYYFDTKHRAQAYANLKMAFTQTKSPDDMKNITKQLFMNYGQNFIDLFRMPLMNPEKFNQFVNIEGKEHVHEALKKGKGVIILAMHFGSWEMASLSCAMLGYPYKMMVKTQAKYSRLDELLNSYRKIGGYEVLTRGMGTRDFIKSLKNNEVIGMVVDQGGRDGVLVPFFKRDASMSVGAIRMGLKWNVPLCFSVIYREGAKHRMIIKKAMELKNTGDLEQDIISNLKNVTAIMERYIIDHPMEYMWFYKIWKYSKEANIVILSDGKMGHLRQSETVANLAQKAFTERDIKTNLYSIKIKYRNKFTQRLFAVFSFLSHPFVHQGRLEFLKSILTKDSFDQVMTTKADMIISCGSSVAGLNNLLAKDNSAKSIVVLKPGLLHYKRFDLVVLPQHDNTHHIESSKKIAVTKAAPNLITKEYIEEQKELLLNRYSHLKNTQRFKIGVFIGGDSKNVYLSESQIRVLINQLKEVTKTLNAELLMTTSRRTPTRLEQMLFHEFKKDPACPLLIQPNQQDVPEAVGGIMGLSDVIVASGDSISMVSEAASSGKNAIVFTPQTKEILLKGSNKHRMFIKQLSKQGYIISCDVKYIGQSIYDVVKNKIQSMPIDDNDIILKALRRTI